jgi:predicted CoA-substrate-specific enzyme activase
MDHRLHLGIDVGSTTVKVVVVDDHHRLLAETYDRSCGQPRPTLLAAVRRALDRAGGGEIAAVGVTGSGGAPIATLIGGRHVNELVAQTRAVAEYHPDARTVIEIGGQDSKLLALERDAGTGELRLLDFAMNALCAAGTGSFLDQQAERLGLDIAREFAELALRSSSPARVAGRCTVFAKSDMIHLQQAGTPLPDIVAGLCLALARNFKAVIGRGRRFCPPIVFQGGVASNAAVVRAFEDVLGLEPGSLLIPRHHCLMAALGAAFIAREEPWASNGGFRGFGALEETVRSGAAEPDRLPRLRTRSVGPSPVSPAVAAMPAPTVPGTRRRSVYLGIDVGSISTCLALVDEDDRLLAHRYILTGGTPLEAVRRGLAELQAEVGAAVDVRGVGATGSGRYLTGDFVGADVVRNEITAQARAAVAFDPLVDTVIEIGGQDSKFIRLHRGVVVDFSMNHACAAGTGSFLEEQAERLRIAIAGEFTRLALSSPAPVSLGARCTVFMESDLIHHQQQGRRPADLTAGLAYSIASNYLERVVDGRTIGERVIFQGGVAWNAAVVAAFEAMLQRPVIVPPHHDVTGAIGVAILAREDIAARAATAAPPALPAPGGSGSPSRFRGFALEDRHYLAEIFECRACPNICEVNRVTMSGEPPMFYGARCDRFDEAGRGRTDHSAGIPDLFAERAEMLLDGHADAAPDGRPRVGIPRALIAFDLFPYWRTFFEELGFGVVLSDATNPTIIRESVETAGVEACFPVKLMYGHVENLVAKGVNFVFLPSVINRERIARGQTHAQYCPYIPAVAHLVTAHIDLAARGVRPLKAALEMSWVPERRTQLGRLAPELGASRRRIVQAAKAARAAQERLYARFQARARRFLEEVREADRAVIVVGRPYNTHDRGATLDLPYKLRRLGVLPVPMDFLPLAEVDVSHRYPNSFWRSGQDILAAAELIRRDPRLSAIYLTNFSCGPDSFLIGFFRRLMGDKPFLELEVDDHTADAGMITRCEAFLESRRSG